MRSHDGSGEPAPPFFLVTDEDALLLRTDHVAGLHRGLLFVLVLTILTMLPAVVWGGSSGRSWLEGNHGVRVFTIPAGRPVLQTSDVSEGLARNTLAAASRSAQPDR